MQGYHMILNICFTSQKRCQLITKHNALLKTQHNVESMMTRLNRNIAIDTQFINEYILNQKMNVKFPEAPRNAYSTFNMAKKISELILNQAQTNRESGPKKSSKW